MTPTEIAALGDRELDVLVAEKVMGWKHWSLRLADGSAVVFFMPDTQRYSAHNKEMPFTQVQTGNEAAAPHYSTDPRAMMEVLEWARRTALYVEVAPAYEGRWVCEIAMDGDQDLYVVAHKLLPRAVAEAALFAVRAKKGARDGLL